MQCYHTVIVRSTICSIDVTEPDGREHSRDAVNTDEVAARLVAQLERSIRKPLFDSISRRRHLHDPKDAGADVHGDGKHAEDLEDAREDRIDIEGVEHHHVSLG